MKAQLSNSISLNIDEQKNTIEVSYKGSTVLTGRPYLELNGKEYRDFVLTSSYKEKDKIKVDFKKDQFDFSLVLRSYYDNSFYLYYEKNENKKVEGELIWNFEFDFTNLEKVLVYHIGRELVEYSKAFGYYTRMEAGLEVKSQPPSDSSEYPPSIEELEHGNELSQSPWSFPVLLKDLSVFSEKIPVIFALAKLKDSLLSLIPASDYGYKSFLRINGKNEKFKVKIRSRCFMENYSSKVIPLASISFGEDPYAVIKNSVLCLKENSNSGIMLRDEKKFPEVFNYLGWCSWNSYLNNVSEEKLIKSIKSFSVNKIPVKFIIIDDGWLSVKDGKLSSFEPDKIKFPNGFKEVAKVAKENGIKFVGVWHTLQGYWGGIDPESFKDYKEFLMEDKLNLKRFLPSPENFKGFKFFHDWYNYLRKEGIKFVKVDNQNDQPTYYFNNIPNQEGARNLLHLLQASAHGNNMEILNCMCMVPESYLNWISSNVARASTDYVPHWKGGAKFHIFFCIFNSLWYSNFTWPDFDMFTTYDPNAYLHAIFRAISGGPIYFTDRYDKDSNVELLRKLSFKDGRIPRPSEPALPTSDIIFEDVYNSKVPLKARTFIEVNGFGKVGILVVANINKNGEVEDFSVSPSDIFDDKQNDYLVYDWREGKFSICKLSERIKGKLNELDWKLYIISPIKEDIGIVGLTDVFISPRGISKIEKFNDGFLINLEDEGTYKILVLSKEIKEVVGNSGKYKYSTNLDDFKTYRVFNGLLEVRTKDKAIFVKFNKKT